MKIRKVAILPLFALFSLIGFSSCEKPPEFSNIPTIEFRSITVEEVFNSDLLAFSDSVAIRIYFQDGDGNLGIQTGDTTALSCDASLDGENYQVETYKMIDGEFTLMESAELKFGGVFPQLSTTVGPIEGTLDYHIFLPHKINEEDSILKTGDTLKFEVFIVDNACNRSNAIVTDSVIFRLDDVQ